MTMIHFEVSVRIGNAGTALLMIDLPETPISAEDRLFLKSLYDRIYQYQVERYNPTTTKETLHA